MVFYSAAQYNFYLKQLMEVVKQNEGGEIMVYHPFTPLPPGFTPGWWGVENKILSIINQSIG
jgi:hypothetical protein